VQGLAPGQSYVFALGITNTLFENSTFYVNLKFLDARDLSNNHIQGADETTIMRWFDKNTFGSYRLGKYEQAFIPVGVTVGDEIGPGKETVPGTYYFRAYIKYQKTSYTVDDFANVEFSFRVV